MTQIQNMCDEIIDADTNFEYVYDETIDADTNFNGMDDRIIDDDTNSEHSIEQLMLTQIRNMCMME